MIFTHCFASPEDVVEDVTLRANVSSGFKVIILFARRVMSPNDEGDRIMVDFPARPMTRPRFMAIFHSGCFICRGREGELKKISKKRNRIEVLIEMSELVQRKEGVNRIEFVAFTREKSIQQLG